MLVVSGLVRGRDWVGEASGGSERQKVSNSKGNSQSQSCRQIATIERDLGTHSFCCRLIKIEVTRPAEGSSQDAGKVSVSGRKVTKTRPTTNVLGREDRRRLGEKSCQVSFSSDEPSTCGYAHL